MMGTADKKDNRNHRTENVAKPVSAERLAQARAYAEQFKFDTLSEEDLKKMRRNAYAYLI